MKIGKVSWEGVKIINKEANAFGGEKPTQAWWVAWIYFPLPIPLATWAVGARSLPSLSLGFLVCKSKGFQ